MAIIPTCNLNNAKLMGRTAQGYSVQPLRQALLRFQVGINYIMRGIAWLDG